MASLLAGILTPIAPRLLNDLVWAYLFVVGLPGLFGDIHLPVIERCDEGIRVPRLGSCAGTL